MENLLNVLLIYAVLLTIENEFFFKIYQVRVKKCMFQIYEASSRNDTRSEETPMVMTCKPELSFSKTAGWI